VHSGVKEVKASIEEAKAWKDRQSRETILFIDEIHRFNKAQQDALLQAVELGEITLVGATTENPSFEVNSALLSRLRVFRLEALREEDLLKIIYRAKSLLEPGELTTSEDRAFEKIAELAQGDARVALNAFEWCLPEVTFAKVEALFAKKFLFHDKQGDLHHQVVSAFIKSMRAGEGRAALYYLARMWEAGEDPLYIARRMVIFASEDIGNADLKALALANAIRHSVEFVGKPECFYALSQGVLYLSSAPKSRQAGDEFQKALEKVRATGAKAVPGFLTNAPTALDRSLGRGRTRGQDESFLPLELED